MEYLRTAAILEAEADLRATVRADLLGIENREIAARRRRRATPVWPRPVGRTVWPFIERLG